MTLIAAYASWIDQPQLLVAAAVVVLLVMILIGSPRQKRELTRAEDKVCGGCGMGHPSFAQFCRKCGKKL